MQHRIASDLIENHPAQDGENDTITIPRQTLACNNSSDPRDMKFFFLPSLSTLLIGQKETSDWRTARNVDVLPVQGIRPSAGPGQCDSPERRETNELWAGFQFGVADYHCRC